MDVGRLERILAEGNDSAALRLALGSAYLKEGSAHEAIEHLSQAVTLDVNYSAAWKLLGQAQTAAEMLAEAERSYTRGIEVATQCGDVQAAREMQVFLKRLQRRRESPQA